MLIKGQMLNKANVNNSSNSAGEAAVLSMPKSLKLGKTIQGQVVSIKGNEIELLLQGKTRISARVDSEMQVSLNQILNFEVNKTSNSVMLRPLFKNLTNDANATKALQAANMQINGDNRNMVSGLMERGLPVDKNSLQEMSRFMTTNPRATGNVLVEMKEFQIPLTNENINQFVAYKGMNHYLVDGMNELSTALNEGMNTLAENHQTITITNVVSSLNHLFQVKEENSQVINTVSNEQVNIDGKTDYHIQNQILSNDAMIEQLDNQIDKSVKMEYIEQTDKQEVALNLQKEIENLKLPEAIKTELEISKGDLPKTFQVLDSLFQNESLNINLNEFVKTEAFQKSVQFLLEEGVYLKPEEFADKEAVKELYKSVKHQVDAMIDVGEQMGKAGQQIYNTANSLQNNVDFMNQINQTFNYIQIPMKDSEHFGKGELFVYAKKKSSLEEGESVSALLHLDMKNLGAMDVRVQMTNDKVQTNFFLEDEKTLNFISEHLPELDAAIERRGYQVQSIASINEEEKDSIENLINREESNETILVSNHSFDARA